MTWDLGGGIDFDPLLCERVHADLEVRRSWAEDPVFATDLAGPTPLPRRWISGGEEGLEYILMAGWGDCPSGFMFREYTLIVSCDDCGLPSWSAGPGPSGIHLRRGWVETSPPGIWPLWTQG